MNKDKGRRVAMEQMKRFLKQKGLYFALLGCIALACAACFWAIRDAMTQPETPTQEEELWNQSSQTVTGQVEDLPETTAKPETTASPKPQSSSAASSGQSTSGTASSEAAVSDSEPESSPQPADSLIWPVEGSILQEFSGDELIYNETLKDWRTHNGVDIASPQGTLVVAMEDGTITAVYTDALWGTVVEQEAGGKIWRYCGLESEVRVAAGDSVVAGDTLGRLLTGDAESSGESHLHLELLRDGRYQDPGTYLK